MKLQEVSVYYTSTCDDTMHSTGIIDVTLISSVVLKKNNQFVKILELFKVNLWQKIIKIHYTLWIQCGLKFQYTYKLITFYSTTLLMKVTSIMPVECFISSQADT